MRRVVYAGLLLPFVVMTAMAVGAEQGNGDDGDNDGDGGGDTGGDEGLCNRDAFHRQGNYTFNSNAWNEDDSGSVCIFVSEKRSNAFYAEWRWLSNPPRVRAYPHIQYNSRLLPLPLSELSLLNLTLEWSMSPSSLIDGVSDDPTVQPNADALNAIGVQANVVADLFCDGERNRSMRAARQRYEIMVWMGRFGGASEPIGMNDGEGGGIAQAAVGDVEFTLYSGTNGNGQTVFSWISSSNLTTFTGDISPLVHFIPRYGLMPWSTFLGVIQFGSETFYAAEDVRFDVKRFQANLDSPDIGAGEPPVNTAVEELPGEPEETGTGGAGMVSVPPVFGSWGAGGKILLAVFLHFLLQTVGFVVS